MSRMNKSIRLKKFLPLVKRNNSLGKCNKLTKRNKTISPTNTIIKIETKVKEEDKITLTMSTMYKRGITINSNKIVISEKLLLNLKNEHNK